MREAVAIAGGVACVFWLGVGVGYQIARPAAPAGGVTTHHTLVAPVGAAGPAERIPAVWPPLPTE